MNEQIKAGADIHGGDGGYSIGTKKKYDEFVKGRNQSLGQMRIKELAIQAGLITSYGSDREGLRDFDYRMFAELIVGECIDLCHKMAEESDSYVVHDGDTCAEQIKQHFGVEE